MYQTMMNLPLVRRANWLRTFLNAAWLGWLRPGLAGRLSPIGQTRFFSPFTRLRGLLPAS